MNPSVYHPAIHTHYTYPSYVYMYILAIHYTHAYIAQELSSHELGRLRSELESAGDAKRFLEEEVEGLRLVYYSGDLH